MDDEALLNEYLEKCHVRLFVSVDLVGSTALKKLAAVDQELPWIITIETFYREFPIQLRHVYSSMLPEYVDQEPFKTTERLAVFKVLGDEILFYVELKRHEQILYHIWAVREAVKDFNVGLAQRYRFLRCKPTAWIAGFPVVNSEIYVTESGRQLPLDYIGPSMDAWFRLTKLATPRKFILAFDLVLMLTDALTASHTASSRLRLFYDGSQPLAGVLGGVPYPIIWVDESDNAPLEERLSCQVREPCNPHELAEFCLAFRESNDLWRWFVKGDQHPNYRGPDHPAYVGPNEWLNRYRTIQAKRELYCKEF